jgi:hypothetical protein
MPRSWLGLVDLWNGWKLLHFTMATSNETNKLRLGNATPLRTSFTTTTPARLSIPSVADAPAAFPAEFDLTYESYQNIKELLRVTLCNIDVTLQLDLYTTSDPFTSNWVRKFYNIQNFVCGIQLQHSNAYLDLIKAMDDVTDLCSGVDSLIFDDSDDDDDFVFPGDDDINQLLQDVNYFDPPTDLTSEGIEPNPGPVNYDIDPPVRFNRYRTVEKISYRQKKEIQTEIKIYNRLLSQARRNRVKTSLIDYDTAQIGPTPLSAAPLLLEPEKVVDDAPPTKDCSICGRERCDCLTKRLTTVATSFSIAQSIVKIVDIISHWLTVNHAQMGVVSWLTGAQPAIDKADTLISDVTERIQGLPTTDSIRSMISETIKTILDSDCGFLPVSIRTILLSLLTVTGLYIIYRMGVLTFDLIILPTSILLDSIYHGAELNQAFRSFCFSNKPDLLDGDNAQIGMDVMTNHLPSAFSLISTLLVTYTIGRIPGRDNSAFGMLTKLGSVPRTAGGIFEIFTWIQKAIVVVWDWVKVKVFGFNPDELEGAIPEIARWMKDVEDLMYAPTRQVVCASYDGRYKAMTLYATGNNLIRKYHSAMTPNLKLVMTNWMREAARIKNLTELHYPETKAIRSVPLALWMVGESQIGKSRLQYLISTELCLEAGIEDAKDQLYPRNIEMEYWDNYQGQFVTIYDDFGQMKDSSANPNLEFFEIIRTVGPFPCPLHMADISQKGTTDFRSKVVIASTNKMDLRIESLTYPDAVWNRLTQSWFVQVKPAYLVQDANGNPLIPNRLDLSKVIEDSPTLNGKKWAINPYIYDFIRFDPRNRNQRMAETGTRIGWDEFIAILKSDLNSRKDQGLALDEFLQSYIDDRRSKAQIGGDESAFDPIASTAASSFAQCGISPSYTLHDLQIALQQDPNPDFNITENDLMDFRMLVSFEVADLDPQLLAKDVLLTTYQPQHFPPQHWQSAMIYFYRMKNPVPSKVTKTMERVRLTATSILNRLEPFARAFMDGLRSVFEYQKKWFAETSNSTWFLIGGSLLGLSAWMEGRYRRQKEELERQREQDRMFDRPHFDNQSSAESDTRNHQPRVRPQPRTTTTARPSLVKNAAEMGQSFGQLDVIAKVRRQQYHLTAVYADGSRTECGTITNVVGQAYIMPNHFLLRFMSRPPVEIIMTNYNTNVVLTRPYATWIDGQAVVLNDEDGLPRDICVFAIREIHRGRDVINHFATQEDLAKMMDRSLDATLSGIDMEGGRPVPVSHGGQCTLLAEKTIHGYRLDGDDIRTTRVAVHRIPTKVGDCGKIISVNSDAVAGRIFGIHISGNSSGRNHAQVISREELISCVELLPSTAQCGHGFVNLKPSTDPFNCALIHLGEFPVKIPQANKTSIVKSRLHGVIQEPLTRPAVLRPTTVTIDGEPVLRDPLLEGAKKAGMKCGYVDPLILESAEIDVRNLIHSQLRPDGPEPRVLTIEEAIKGIPNDELFSPVNRTTSPGFPYSQHPKPGGFAGKTFWLGKGDEWSLDTPQALSLLNDCAVLEDDCANSRPTDILWIDTLKDERLPHAKVDIAKTRIISNGPMHYNIVFRKYFLAAMAHIRHNRILNGVAIGINVWSSEWHHLALHLTSNSPHVIDGDFQNYDGTLMDQLMWSVFRIFNSFYDDEHSILRYNLWHAACYATRYNQGQVYQCTHSLPSGFPATAEANSVYELILFRCAFIKLAIEHGHGELANMQSFNELVRIVTYGDDNLLSISPKVIDWYNMHTLVKCMSSFGMTYTTAQKTTEYDKFRSIDDVSFLKRYFKRVDTGFGLLPVYTCPAPLDTRLDILNWTKVRKFSSLPEEADAVTTVFQELAVHGKDVYDRESRRVAKAAIDHGITGFIQLSLMDYLTKFMTGDLPRILPSPILHFVPQRCDLATNRQNSDVPKVPSSAISGGCVAIQPYTLGPHEAAPQCPRDRQSDE